MSRVDHEIQSYLATLADESEEGTFLRSTPWIIDAVLQSPDALLKAIRFEAGRFTEFIRKPRISLLAVLRNTRPEHLRELILSARCQSYQHWQLVLVDDGSTAVDHLELARKWMSRDERIILTSLQKPLGPSRARNLALELSSGEFIAVVDGDGVLHPMALGVLARYFNLEAEVNFLFSNEAELDGPSKSLLNFQLKPPFDLFTLLRIAYVGRLTAVKRSLLDAATLGESAFRDCYDGIEEHDLLLRLARSPELKTRHIVSFLYYRRAGSRDAFHQSCDALATKRRHLFEEHVPQIHAGAAWTAKIPEDPSPHAASSLWITDFPARETPKLLVVIGFKDQVETTIQCVESIERQEHRLDVLVALVNNRSVEPGTLARLRAWTLQPRSARYEILDHDGSFNFAKLNNGAVARLGANCDLVLLLNNDVELTTPQCLQTMAMQLLADPRSGFVGIKLLYPGGTEIQHGGVRIGPLLAGSGYNEIPHARSDEEYVDAERFSLGVTFACAMTRRQTFEQLGGLDEIFVPNAFGDVDMCLRAVEAGYRNYYMGTLSAIHHESKTRGSCNEDFDVTSLYERQGRVIAAWRLRYLHRSHRHAWTVLVLPWDYFHAEAGQQLALLAPDAAHAPCSGPPLPGPLPLRYRIADRLAAILKRALGPAYQTVRGSVVKAIAVRNQIRSEGALSRTLKAAIRPIPIVGPLGVRAVRATRRLRARSIKGRRLIQHIWRSPSQGCSLVRVLHSHGYAGFREELSYQVPSFRSHAASPQEWFELTRPSASILARMRLRKWPKGAPVITVLMPVYNVREDWLRQAIESVIQQTYLHWELVCVNDASPASHIRRVLDELARRDARVVVIHADDNRGVSAATNTGLEVASGDYVAFMDHDDTLEPHALHHFAEAILRDRPDMLYSDEVITSEDLTEIKRIAARSCFSYDYYLGHPYFVHLVAARTELVRKIGGLDEAMNISQDVDLNLRLIEQCQTISHIPEVLYRWRLHTGSHGHQKVEHCRSMTRGALQRHFARTGQDFAFDDESHFNFRDVRFSLRRGAKVAIFVAPSRNRELTGACLESLKRTVDRSIADIIVIKHPAYAPDCPLEMDVSIGEHRVVACRGAWNVANITNHAVAAVRGSYTHYLFLDPEITAKSPGWLEHMLGYGQRPDVGVVGALLVDGQETVAHAGFVIGSEGSVGHWQEGIPLRIGTSRRNLGHDGTLLASRDVTAVSAACLLTRADLFESVSGFDEEFVTALHDIDYCLRARSLGYKTILDAYAVLCVAGSQRGGMPSTDRRPKETRFLRERYRGLMIQGDPFSSPSFARYGSSEGWSLPVAFGMRPPVRTVRVVLPSPARAAQRERRPDHQHDETVHRPHFTSQFAAGSQPNHAMNPRSDHGKG